MAKYFDELTRAMSMLAEHDKTVFVGQACQSPGTGMYNTLLTGNTEARRKTNYQAHKFLEFPVAEEMQMGFSIGLALEGLIPISIYPRWNFLLSAINQMINHLDKLPLMGYKPKVIIRTSIGSERPLHPSHQHVGDFTEAIRLMSKTMNVVRLDEPDQIFPAYQHALERKDGVSTLLVEWGDYYGEK